MHLGSTLRLLVGVLLGVIFAAHQNAWALPLVYVYGQADFLASNSGLLATAGDFNGDGRPDFAVISYENNSVSILLGQPDGSFTDTNVIYPVGTNPIAAVVEDLNRDGNPDLVVVCQACPASDPFPGPCGVRSSAQCARSGDWGLQ